MRRWIHQLDQVLRGQATAVAALRQGQIELPATGLLVLIVLMGMFYGTCMGCYALINAWGTPQAADGIRQLLASTLKLPMLYLLTLLVTFPSLYVFNALIGSRLTLLSVLRLLVASLSVMLAVLASFGTIVAFFSFTTSSHPFMVLLNVLACAVAGFLGLAFLLQTLHRLSLNELPEEIPMTPSLEGEVAPPETEDGALQPVKGRVMRRNVKVVFRVWVIVFGLVGAQMSWVLRPFIDCGGHFSWFRPRESNFFEAVFRAFHQLLG